MAGELYYNAENIVAFPSNNAYDEGKITSEPNVRDIVTRVTEMSYRLNTSSFNVTVTGNTSISVSAGEANIKGYKIVTNAAMSMSIPSGSGTTYYVLLKLDREDMNRYLKGNNYSVDSNENKFMGAYLYLSTTEPEYPNTEDYLYICSVTISQQTGVPIVIMNPHIDSRINPKDIYVDFFGDDNYLVERGYHGIMTLYDYVKLTNRTFISQYGDNVYDNLYFTKKSWLPNDNINIPYRNIIQGSLELFSQPTEGLTFKSNAYTDTTFVGSGTLKSSIILRASNRQDNDNGLSIQVNDLVSRLYATGFTTVLENDSSTNKPFNRIKLSSNHTAFNTFKSIVAGSNPTTLWSSTGEVVIDKGISILSEQGNIYLEGNVGESTSNVYDWKNNLYMAIGGNQLMISPKTSRTTTESPLPLVKYLLISTAKTLDNAILYPKIKLSDLITIDTQKSYYQVSDHTDEHAYSDPYIYIHHNAYDLRTSDLTFYNDTPGVANYNKGIRVYQDTTVNPSSEGFHLAIDGYTDIHGGLTALENFDLYHMNGSSRERIAGIDHEGNFWNAGDIDTNGDITAVGDITGARVFNAVYNDYADFVKKDKSNEYEPGDIIAKKKGSDEYTLATYETRKLVVGVYSDNYGHVLGGEKLKNMEDNKENYIPLGVAGNVHVKVLGFIEEGDLITVDRNTPGVGRRVMNPAGAIGTIVGKALESNYEEGIHMILMQIMLT